MAMKVLFVKEWNEKEYKKNESFAVDKKYCANSWNTTIGELYIPKVYVVSPKARQVTFKEWVEMSSAYKMEDSEGLKLHKAVVNIVDRSVCVLTEREMIQKGGAEAYFRNIADGLDRTYAARLHGLINKYFDNTALGGEWKHMDRKIKVKTTMTKNDSKHSSKKAGKTS